MSELIVKNVSGLVEFLNGIIKIVPSCKFELNKSGCKVSAISDNKTIRAYFLTDAISSEEECSFSFMDLSLLFKSIKLLDNSDIKDCVLNFDGTFIYHTGKIKFKLKVCKPEAIDKYLSSEIKTQLDTIYSFECEADTIKRVCSQLSIVEQDNSKVYFVEQDGNILAELDDKSNVMSNSISIPLADNYQGKYELATISFANFKLFSVLSGNVKVIYTNKTVFDIRSNAIIGENNNMVKVVMRLICSSIKG